MIFVIQTSDCTPKKEYDHYESKTGIMGRSIQGNQTSRNCYWKKKYLASKGKVCADISPWITITEAALEIRDQAGGFAAGDFFGFATTFFSGALRLVPAAAAAVFFGLAVAALFFGFAAALACLGRDGLGGCGLGWPWEPPSWRRRSRAGQEKQSTEEGRRCREGRCGGAVASCKGRRASALALDRPQGRLGSIGITTLKPLFCLGLNHFDPWALERGGATSKEGRPAPLAG